MEETRMLPKHEYGRINASASSVRPRVINVVGLNFSGSSVLNLILGAHSAVHGGGELHKLFHPTKIPRCSICQYKCVYWTPQRLEEVAKATLYPYISSLFDAPVVVNSSKLIEHFEDLNRFDNAEHSYLLLFKHPMRHLASFVSNKFIVENDLVSDADVGGLNRYMPDIIDYASKRAAKLEKLYTDTYDRLDRLRGYAPLFRVRYEDLVTAPAETLQPVLSSVGLVFEPAMLNYKDAILHPIGGNRGPHFQLQNNLSTKHFTGYRKQYYSNAAGLRMDDKFLQTFSQEAIAEISQEPSYMSLCALLGYELGDLPPQAPSTNMPKRRMWAKILGR